MTPELFQAIATDPAAFEAELMIPVDGEGRRFGDVMADYQRERFAALNPALVAVANGKRPKPGKFWLEATKGNSKTSDLAAIILWALAFSHRPLLCQAAASDADQAAELKKAAAEQLRFNAWLDEVIEIQTGRIVCDRTNSACEILAADVAGSHGARPDLLIVDEIVHVQKTAFLENLLDNTSKVPNCLTIVATNAGFTGSWAWKLRELARSSSRWHFDQRTEPAPWIDLDEMREAEARNTPTRFRRLWQGVWSSGTGDALDPDTIDASIILAGPSNSTPEGAVAVAGLDLGVKKDHSALVVLGCDGNTQRVSLLDCQSWQPSGGQVDLIEVREAIIRANYAYRLNAIYFDPSQALLMAQELRQQNIRMEEMAFVGANLGKMASAILDAFRSGKLGLYDDPALIDDLKRLNIVERSWGLKLEAPADKALGHCDRALALSICLPAALEPASEPPRDDGTIGSILGGHLAGPKWNGVPFGYVQGRRRDSLWHGLS